jgi:hypothetical protein
MPKPKWADMNWLRLMEGPSNLTVLDISPTMKNITHRGERYFRMQDSWSTRLDGEPEERTECGALYLWAKWMPKGLAEKRAVSPGTR